MNQKKCPKCGENNPPEAVMCWACYTPLSGGGVAPATAGPGGRGPGGAAAMTADAGGGVTIPSWVYGVGGAVLVIALLVGAKVLLFSGNSDDASAAANQIQQNYTSPSSGSPPPRSSAPSIQSPGVSPQSPPPNPGGPGGDIGFSFVLTPNATYTVGVMGILPKTPVGAQQAATFAKFAAGIYMSRHKEIQVFVFSDAQTADRFKSTQLGRKNAPMGQQDFMGMADLWPNTPVVCDVTASGTKTYQPSSDGNFWENLVH